MAALFTPLKVGNMTLSHRIALAPLTRFRATDAHVHTRTSWPPPLPPNSARQCCAFAMRMIWSIVRSAPELTSWYDELQPWRRSTILNAHPLPAPSSSPRRRTSQRQRGDTILSLVSTPTRKCKPGKRSCQPVRALLPRTSVSAYSGLHSACQGLLHLPSAVGPRSCGTS
jgi:hypothetical protein